jgi:hypothetical protein
VANAARRLLDGKIYHLGRTALRYGHGGRFLKDAVMSVSFEQVPLRNSYRDALAYAADAAQRAIWANQAALAARSISGSAWMPGSAEHAATARYWRAECHRHLADAIGFASQRDRYGR